MLSVQFRDPSANVIRTDSLVLAPLQHKAFSSVVEYPETDGKNGVIEFVVSGAGGQYVGASALALLFSPRGTFSTIPSVAILPVRFEGLRSDSRFPAGAAAQRDEAAVGCHSGLELSLALGDHAEFLIP